MVLEVPLVFTLWFTVKCEMREAKRTLKLKKLGLHGAENSQVLQWENGAKMKKELLIKDQSQGAARKTH